METTSRTYPATNFAAFRNETLTGNNNLQVPTARMSPNGLMDWLHEGSVTIPLLPVGFPAQKMVECVELLGSPYSFQRRQSSFLKNKYKLESY